MKEDGVFTIYIDRVHAVHRDCRGQGGLIGTFGTGAILSKTGKLGLTTTSSTETEICFTGQYLPKRTWFRYFRMAQGEFPKEDILMQDN